MFRSIFTLQLALLISASVCGQTIPKSNPSLPGYSGFHSNLGIQEIIEVGIPLQKAMPSFDSSKNVGLPSVTPPPLQSQAQDSVSSFNLSTQAGARAYSTSNVLRQNDALAKSSGVMESSLGVALSHEAFKLSEYVTMLPRLDFMMQWAWYGESSELLDYRFGLVKGGIAFGFPNNWSVGTSLDYNTLYNLHSGDKSFDSVSPSVSLQKIIPSSETSFFMIDSMIRWSNMDTTISFPAAGIFPDSTDNYQTSLSLTYLRMFGAEQQWTIMPRVAINRTNYTKDPNTGRLDYLFNSGLTLMYNVSDWFGIQGFTSYSSMDSDDPDVPDFKAFDTGISVNANYRF